MCCVHLAIFFLLLSLSSAADVDPDYSLVLGSDRVGPQGPHGQPGPKPGRQLGPLTPKILSEETISVQKAPTRRSDSDEEYEDRKVFYYDRKQGGGKESLQIEEKGLKQTVDDSEPPPSFPRKESKLLGLIDSYRRPHPMEMPLEALPDEESPDHVHREDLEQPKMAIDMKKPVRQQQRPHLTNTTTEESEEQNEVEDLQDKLHNVRKPSDDQEDYEPYRDEQESTTENELFGRKLNGRNAGKAPPPPPKPDVKFIEPQVVYSNQQRNRLPSMKVSRNDGRKAPIKISVGIYEPTPSPHSHPVHHAVDPAEQRHHRSGSYIENRRSKVDHDEDGQDQPNRAAGGKCILSPPTHKAEPEERHPSRESSRKQSSPYFRKPEDEERELIVERNEAEEEEEVNENKEQEDETQGGEAPNREGVETVEERDPPQEVTRPPINAHRPHRSHDHRREQPMQPIQQPRAQPTQEPTNEDSQGEVEVTTPSTTLPPWVEEVMYEIDQHIATANSNLDVQHTAAASEASPAVNSINDQLPFSNKRVRPSEAEQHLTQWRLPRINQGPNGPYIPKHTPHKDRHHRHRRTHSHSHSLGYAASSSNLVEHSIESNSTQKLNLNTNDTLRYYHD